NNTSNNENKDQPDKIKIMECGTDILNVRFGPSTSEKVLGKLKKGDKVEVLYEVNRNWARIKYNGGHGYVSLQYLVEVNSKPNPSKPTTMYCSASILNVRKGPSSKDSIIAYFKKNDKVEVIENLNNGWSRINYNNGHAYVSSQYLSKSISGASTNNSNFMKCNTDALNVRTGPSTSEDIIGQLKRSDKVEIVYHVSTGWTKIKYSNRYAYVNTHYLTAI
ncbi:MAG: SH3 domain-containing protein, partial [Peptostreptococcaceae bacterium]